MYQSVMLNRIVYNCSYETKQDKLFILMDGGYERPMIAVNGWRPYLGNQDM